MELKSDQAALLFRGDEVDFHFPEDGKARAPVVAVICLAAIARAATDNVWGQDLLDWYEESLA